MPTKEEMKAAQDEAAKKEAAEKKKAETAAAKKEAAEKKKAAAEAKKGDELEIVLLPPGDGRRIVAAEKAHKLVAEKKAMIVGKPKPSSKASRD